MALGLGVEPSASRLTTARSTAELAEISDGQGGTRTHGVRSRFVGPLQSPLCDPSDGMWLRAEVSNLASLASKASVSAELTFPDRYYSAFHEVLVPARGLEPRRRRLKDAGSATRALLAIRPRRTGSPLPHVSIFGADCRTRTDARFRDPLTKRALSPLRQVGIYVWSRRRESNPVPSDYQPAALPSCSSGLVRTATLELAKSAV